jgi:hypothetical protein
VQRPLSSSKECLFAFSARARAQHPQFKSLELLVHLCREDRVTVMEEETIGMIAWNRFAKLLQDPDCRWMRSDVAISTPTTPA